MLGLFGWFGWTLDRVVRVKSYLFGELYPFPLAAGKNHRPLYRSVIQTN